MSTWALQLEVDTTRRRVHSRVPQKRVTVGICRFRLRVLGNISYAFNKCNRRNCWTWISVVPDQTDRKPQGYLDGPREGT